MVCIFIFEGVTVNCTMLNLKYCLRGFIQFVLLTIGSISAIDSKVVTVFSLRSIFDSCVLSIHYINHHAGNFRVTDNFFFIYITQEANVDASF